MRRQLRICTLGLGCLAALALFASTASADPISMTINSVGSPDGGFRFSVLHSANGTGTGWATSGSISGNLAGVLNGNYDGTDTITGLTGSISGGLGGLTSYINSETGGSYSSTDPLALLISDGGFHDNGSNAGGYLDYRLFVDGDNVHVGTLFFADRTFMTGPNPDANDMMIGSVGRDFTFWGNNFKNTGYDWEPVLTALGKSGYAGQVTTFNQLRLGIDLGGQTTTTSIPEPGSMALLCLGSFGIALARRRRKAS